jgi:hypothetical protein
VLKVGVDLLFISVRTWIAVTLAVADIEGLGVGSLVVDVLDLEPGDARVMIKGPAHAAYLNFQCPACGSPYPVEEQYFLER